MHEDKETMSSKRHKIPSEKGGPSTSRKNYISTNYDLFCFVRMKHFTCCIVLGVIYILIVSGIQLCRQFPVSLIMATGNSSFIVKYIMHEDKETMSYKRHKTPSKKGGPFTSRKNYISSNYGMLCPVFHSGLGNNIFQFASTFGIAKSKNMTILVNKNARINKVFKLSVKVRNDTSVCNSFKRRNEKLSASYDDKLINFSPKESFKLQNYLQSWKYFFPLRKELKEQLTFRVEIMNIVKKNIVKILHKFNNVPSYKITLVGVHIRRGDMVNNKQGYNVASPEYLIRAVNYFKERYQNIIFIVASNGMPWAKKYMPSDISVEFIQNSDVVDMATLASCNHTIITIGSFGWWSGWLAGGEVTYFKWPAKSGSGFEKRINYTDYFYPGWIGL
ncbi:galactoside alpha-(1,2)-fucosyltransferase 2-like [Mytilus californianus]|uniref:galactoside alpha-(1,2)-fucosyltransferase 2-like n=1 Tax=Mytilus californianus TaxID=6549 RepID=UPI002246860D|nr:galactoside alpha-(1,2)-fucosyltransferase 2-like [Mytilus californianus]XP_052094093.1 galactoside alpha-(1,2)-fucosyltransferase 2-like [Mytilus californianus]XP_052094095.1 galactoside alpha-(1,2)-fucosyltransferase 2-like [Mytilus californianus]